MGALELYDGEKRTAYWWKIITVNSIITPIFFLCLFILLVLYGDAIGFKFNASWEKAILHFLNQPSHRNFIPGALIVGTIILGFLLFGLSLVYQNLMFSFFFWNIRLFFIVGLASSFIVIAIKIMFGSSISGTEEAFHIMIGIPMLCWLIVVFIKTAIIFSKFKVVDQKEKKRYV